MLRVQAHRGHPAGAATAALLLLLSCCCMAAGRATAEAPAIPKGSVIMQIFGFNLTASSSRDKAAACLSLGKALASPGNRRPNYHTYGSNWQNITTAFSRPFPTHCGGFSFFNSASRAALYRQALGRSRHYRGLVLAHVREQGWSAMEVPGDHPVVGNITKLPFIHLIQYNLKPGLNRTAVLKTFELLSEEAPQYVEGYQGWQDLLAIGDPTPNTDKLRPWFTFGGFVPAADVEVLDRYLNYSIHSKTHSSGAGSTTDGVHVMFKQGVVSPDTFNYAIDWPPHVLGRL